MPNPEQFNDGDRLYEISYPGELRSDHASVSYTDSSGNTYLEPLFQHDYDFSQRLIDQGLSPAEIVEKEGHSVPLLKYGEETDLLPLASLLNSSLDHPEALPDVTTALGMVVLLLKRVVRKTGSLPASPILPMFAVDKSSSNAEMLAPYYAASTRGITLADALNDLRADMLERCDSDFQRRQLEECFEHAVNKVGLGDGKA